MSSILHALLENVPEDEWNVDAVLLRVATTFQGDLEESNRKEAPTEPRHTS